MALYKGYKIVKTKGVVEVISPRKTRFIVGLDDSKISGNRCSVKGANTIKNAKMYIDWARRTR